MAEQWEETMAAVQPVSSLKDVGALCASMNKGDSATFTVPETVSQQQASAFARELNERHPDHLWIQAEVVGQGHAPDEVTKIEVRCTH